MNFLTKLADYIIPQPRRWLIQDIAYFVDKNKYPDQSPLQDSVKKVSNLMMGSIFMGVIGTVGIMFSLRRQLYGNFRVFTYKRAATQLITVLSLTTALLYLNTFKARPEVIKIKKQLLQMNSPMLYDHLRTRLFNEPGIHQYELFKDIMKKQEYDEWKKKTKITL